jgi:hypothetical protein
MQGDQFRLLSQNDQDDAIDQMKKILFIVFFVATPMSAQNRIYVSFSPGINIYDSENSSKTVGDKELLWSQGLSIAYVTDGYWRRMNLDIEYNYTYSRANDVQIFTATGSAGSLQPPTFAADLLLKWHNVDIDLNWRLSRWLSFSVGPSIAYVGRSIIIDHLPFGGQNGSPASFEDRLQSLCTGLNGSINGEIPLTYSENYPFLLIHSKTRYLHSVWFDARGRKLSNYSQTFILDQINIGVGYRF